MSYQHPYFFNHRRQQAEDRRDEIERDLQRLDDADKRIAATRAKGRQARLCRNMEGFGI